jgi:peroxiredoxin/uncharacterized membrane protein YphA (DoxX/SURF4 family)
MKAITIFSRIFVGALFIFSGLIKANDITGFSYKLDEYWEVFHMPFMMSFSLLQALVICVVEVVLGAAVLMNIKPKITQWLLLLMIVFFTFLTFYSAYFNKVTGCGCFGDAIPLTPWQSFYKDLILLVFIGILFAQRNRLQFEGYESKNTSYGIVIGGFITVFVAAQFLLQFSEMWLFTLVILFISLVMIHFLKSKAEWPVLIWLIVTNICFSYIAYAYLPFKDFRPYAIGKNISEQMQGTQDVLKYFYRLKNKATGKEQEFDKFPDFNLINEDGIDVTQDILNAEKPILLVVAYNLDKTSIDAHQQLNAQIEEIENAGISIFGLSASNFETIETFRHQVQAAYPYLNADEVTLKTMIRSNPGFILIQKGTVKGMWHYNQMPDKEELMKHL